MTNSRYLNITRHSQPVNFNSHLLHQPLCRKSLIIDDSNEQLLMINDELRIAGKTFGKKE